jgi:hypothetical protein
MVHPASERMVDHLCFWLWADLWAQIMRRGRGIPAYKAGLRDASQAPLVGLTFGLGVWAVSYLGLMPALGLHESATEHLRRRNLLMIAAHAVWGTAPAGVSGMLDANRHA